jgi:hypothetical protein
LILKKEGGYFKKNIRCYLNLASDDSRLPSK